MFARTEFAVVVKIEQDSIAAPARIYPSIPQPCECEQGIVMHSKVERLLFPAVTPPLKKPVGGNQAALAGECISVSGLISGRLRARIDGAGANTGVFCPGWNQTPAGQREVAVGLRSGLPNDTYSLRRCNVVARFPIDIIVSVEVFRDQLLASGETIATTHQ